METLGKGLQTHYGASSQSCRSIDADAWYKWALKLLHQGRYSLHLPDHQWLATSAGGRVSLDWKHESEKRWIEWVRGTRPSPISANDKVTTIVTPCSI